MLTVFKRTVSVWWIRTTDASKRKLIAMLLKWAGYYPGQIVNEGGTEIYH